MTDNTDQTPDDHPDLPARIDAATAIRRLSHAIVSHRADISTLHRIASAADQLAVQIEAQPLRGRLDEMLTNPRFVKAMDGGSLEGVIEDGAFVDLFHDSPVSGSANPLGMGLRLRRDANESVGSVILAAGWEGAPGRAHGGVVAACVDETIGGLLPIIGTMAFTGELNLRYSAPCPLATPIEFRARLVNREGRKLYIECTGSSSEGVFIESSALFIAVDPSQLASMADQ
ncbi:MAG: hotdog domain-containing protein [Acidimicrobiales bacterium]